MWNWTESEDITGPGIIDVEGQIGNDEDLWDVVKFHKLKK